MVRVEIGTALREAHNMTESHGREGLMDTLATVILLVHCILRLSYIDQQLS